MRSAERVEKLRVWYTNRALMFIMKLISYATLVVALTTPLALFMLKRLAFNAFPVFLAKNLLLAFVLGILSFIVFCVCHSVYLTRLSINTCGSSACLEKINDTAFMGHMLMAGFAGFCAALLSASTSFIVGVVVYLLRKKKDRPRDSHGVTPVV